MIQQSASSTNLLTIKLEDFGVLQTRYQSLKLANRAAAVVKDALPALDVAEEILSGLADNSNTQTACENLRSNYSIVNKMRHCEAKNMLLDAGNDYVLVTRRKLAAWRRTIERLSSGEDIMLDQGREYVPIHAPIATAIMGVSNISSYLSITQLILGEMAKLDQRQAKKFNTQLVEIRRAATLLADCEHASGISQVVH